MPSKVTQGANGGHEFVQGVAYAVAELIRRDDMVVAQEIWECATGTEGKSVLRWVDDFDAKPIRAAMRNGWVGVRRG
jgi:hypothetical protein